MTSELHPTAAPAPQNGLAPGRCHLVRTCALVGGGLGLFRLAASYGTTQLLFDEIGPENTPARGTLLILVVLGTVLALASVRSLSRALRTAALLAAALAALAAAQVVLDRLLGRGPSWEAWLGMAGRGQPRMALEMAFVLLSSLVGAAALLPPLSRSGLIRILGLVGSLGSLWAGLTVVSLYLARTQLSFLVPQMLVPFPTGIAITAIGIGLLAAGRVDDLALDFLFGIRERRPWQRAVLLALSATAAAACGAGGARYLVMEASAHRSDVAKKLTYFADRKVHDISAWLVERLGDAQLVSTTPHIAEDVARLAARPEAPQPRADIAAWARALAASYGYSAVIVLGPDMRVLLSEPATADVSTPGERADIASAVRSGGLHKLDVVREQAGGWHMEFVVPLRQEEGSPSGAVVLRVDPAQTLFPLLRGEPEIGRSADFRLLYREGDYLTNLNPALDLPGSTPQDRVPFGTRRPIGDSSLLGSRVLRGESGEVDAVDYRGVPVLGLGRKIPGTSWILDAKIDQTEVYGNLLAQDWRTSARVAAAAAFVTLGIGLVLRRRQAEALAQELAGERSLRAMSERLALVMRHANEGLLLLDDDMRIIEANEKAASLYGCARERLIGMSLMGLKPADTDPAWLKRMFNRPEIATGTVFETEHCGLNGVAFPVEVSVRAVELDGRPHHLTFVRNITARRAVLDRLREARRDAELKAAELEAIYEAAPAAIFVTRDPECRSVWGNRVARELLGAAEGANLSRKASPNPGQARGIRVMKDGRELPASELPFERASRGEVVRDFDFDLSFGDGSVRTLSGGAVPLRDADGRLAGTVGVFLDVTDRRRAEDTLRVAHDMLVTSQRIGRLGSWRIDHPSGRLSWSDETFRIFEIKRPPAGEAVGPLLSPLPLAEREHFRSLMHPEDQERVDRAFDEAVGSGIPFRSTHRVVMPDGRVKMVVENCTTSYAANGSPLFSLGTVFDITDQFQAQEALRASEAVLSAIFENAQVGICYSDAQGSMARYNPRLCAMLGYSPEELPRVHFSSFTRPEDIAREEKALAEMRSGLRTTYAADKVYVRKDGSDFWGHLAISAVRSARGELTGFAVVVEDITERVRAQEALTQFNLELEGRIAARTSELAARTRELEGLIGSLPDVVLICDRSGEPIYCHPPRSEDRPAFLAGCPGCDSGRCQSPLILSIAREASAAALETGRTLIRESERQFDGKPLWIEVRASPVGKDRTLMLLRDISPRKLVEREVAANLKRERELSELKSHFVSVASHEFRTPLAGAVGSVDMLDRYGDRLTPERRAEVLRRLKNSHRRLTDIMDNVLTVSRAEVGRIQVEPVPTDIKSFLQDTIDEMTVSDHGRHRIALEWAGADPMVRADQKLMHHIVSNLLANAARYSPEGTTIRVSAAAQDGGFSVTVADDGIGVPEADRRRIFEPFVRGSNVGEASGTGLGLNIVKRYCEVMGGKVELLPGERGASFRVEIPFTKGEEKGA